MTTKADEVDCRRPTRVNLRRRHALRRPNFPRRNSRDSSGQEHSNQEEESSDEEKENSSSEARKTDGSSLELAPSLLSIYDNLAASETGTSQEHQHHDVHNDLRNNDPLRNDHHLGVTRPCSGFWVTERDSHQRYFVHACARVSFSGRPVSMMEPARESSVDGEKEAKKRPLSISSLSSVSSTSLPRLQHKRPNLTRDAGEESYSDRASQNSSDSNLAWAMADQASLTSTDQVSLASTDSGTGVSSSIPSSVSSSISTSLPSKCAMDGRSRSGSSSVDGPGIMIAVSDRLKPQVEAKYDGDAELDVNDSVSGCRKDSGESLTNSLCPPQSTSPTPGSPSGSRRSSESSTPGRAKTPPVVMKPLQTTIRPVIISLPETIRRSSRSNVSLCGGDTDSCGSSVDGGDSSIDGGSAAGDAASSVTSSSTAIDSNNSNSSFSSDSSVTVTPRRASNLKHRHSFQGHGVGSPSGLASVKISRAASITGNVPGLLNMNPANPQSSKPSPAPPVSPPGHTSNSPQHQSPVRSVVQQYSSSPLSPTAIARRRFLASHFDIPDVPPLDTMPQVNGHHDVTQEQSGDQVSSTGQGMHASPDNNSPRVPSSPGSTPGVSSFTDRSPVSPRGNAPPLWSVTNGSLAPPQACASASASDVSTPSPSPTTDDGDFNLSFAKETTGTSSGGVTPTGSPPQSRGIPRSPSSDYDNVHKSGGEETMDTKSSSRHSSGDRAGGKSPTTSPSMRSRNHKKQDSGGSGVSSSRSGSTKSGSHSYVSYVQRVVAEIVDTERMYIDSLEEIIKGYLQPLENLLDTKVGREDLACLFCNIRDIYTFGKIFLWDLEQCGLDPVKVADCFVRHNEGFVIYTDYCTNYPRAVEVLTRFMQDTELSEVCKSCQVSLGHGLPLGAYLLRPVQRILKYHLLLQNILKNFDKSKPGYSTLEKALKHMTAMAHHINEMKRRHEHAVRIQEVQSQVEDYGGEDLTRLGELVLEGSFRVYGAKASRQVFLFEKGILITKKKEGGMLTCKAFIPCSNLMLVEVIPNEPLSFHTIPFDNPRAQHTLQARSMEQKRHWCQEIKRLILESYKGRIPDNVKSLVMELGRNHDNDYVGKDAFDSPWKHQHTAPEYLEKRRVRKKSGAKIPDFGPLLKVPKPGAKKDQGGATKKSPKPWRKSDSKLLGGNRDRSESLPAMLTNASTGSLPGIPVPGSTSSESVPSEQQSTTSSTLHGSYSDDNNNNTAASSDTLTSSSIAVDPLEVVAADGESEGEGVQRRAASFKRAVRMNPVDSVDLKDLLKTASDVKQPHVKMESSSAVPSRQTDYRDSSSLSECEESSDTDSDEVQTGNKNKNRRSGVHGQLGSPGAKLNMYSSMPALNALQRKPAQKRKPGEGRMKNLSKTGHVSRSSEVLAGDKSGSGSDSRSSSTRQYRRRWEGTEDGLQKKVPALHDTYTRSRENLLRKKALRAGDKSLQESRSAKLTNWGSVDKLTHGSLSDLSHLNEDPWIKNTDSPTNSPLSKESVSFNRSVSADPRSLSLSAVQSRDWNPANWSMTTGRIRNYSDAAEHKSGKENLDWLVYLNRNAGDPDIRQRANSLTQLSRPNKSGDIRASVLRESNSSLLRSSSLCKDTLKRYSLEMNDDSVQFSLGASNSQSSVTSGSVGSRKGSDMSVDRTSNQSATDQDDMVSGSSTSTLCSTRGSLPKMASSFDSSTSQPSYRDSQQTSLPGPPTPHPSTFTSPSVTQLLTPQPFSPKHSDVTHITSPKIPQGRSRSSGSQTPTSPVASREMSPQIQDQNVISNQWDQSGQQTTPHKADITPSLPHGIPSSQDSERMIAEMQQYYETHSPNTPPPTAKFPAGEEITPSQSNESPHHPLLSCEDLNVNRLSGVSSLSSSSAEGHTGVYHVHHAMRDLNPNRLSGVSSISTSSYESQNSNSSDSIVGTLKNKLSVLSHKLGGRKSRDDDSLHSSQLLSASRDGLASPTAGAELQEVLREHAPGSSLIGSRMANTLPVGMETILSPSSKTGSKESTPESQTRFSFPPSGHKQHQHAQDSDVFSTPRSVQQSDSGISMHSSESGDSRSRKGKYDQCQSNSGAMKHHDSNIGESERRRRGSASSVGSSDSFYERRLSVAFELSIANEGEGEPRSPDSALVHRKSIKEVVHFIEEKFRPHQPAPIEVKRREPSALIRQRLQSLRDSSTYRRRTSNRSVSEDRSRVREPTPESPRTPRGKNRSRSNQFMHRVQAEPAKACLERQAELEAEREREKERELALLRREQATQNRQSEERSEASTSSLSRTTSMERLEQLNSDDDNLVVMRGLVRNLINKFQQFK